VDQSRREQLLKLFQHFDVESKGFLLFGEFYRVARLLDPSYTAHKLREVFGKSDSDNNQKIDADEFVKLGLSLTAATVQSDFTRNVQLAMHTRDFVRRAVRDSKLAQKHEEDDDVDSTCPDDPATLTDLFSATRAGSLLALRRLLGVPLHAPIPLITPLPPGTTPVAPPGATGSLDTKHGDASDGDTKAPSAPTLSPKDEIKINTTIDINAKDSQGNTALYYALACGHRRVVELLLAAGGVWDDRALRASATRRLKDMLRARPTRRVGYRPPPPPGEE